MARKKNKKTLGATEPIIDPAYRDHYEAQIRFNDYANLNVKLDLTGNVTSQATEGYVPSEVALVIERPEINKKFTLSGSFTEEPIGPAPVVGKTLFIYGKNSNGDWLNAAGDVSERPVALMTTQLPTDTELSIKLPMITGFVVDNSKPAVDFNGNTVGTISGGSLVISIEDDTNAVITYKEV